MNVSKMASTGHPFPETPESERQHSSGGLATGLQGNHPPPPPPPGPARKKVPMPLSPGAILGAYSGPAVV